MKTLRINRLFAILLCAAVFTLLHPATSLAQENDIQKHTFGSKLGCVLTSAETLGLDLEIQYSNYLSKHFNIVGAVSLSHGAIQKDEIITSESVFFKNFYSSAFELGLQYMYRKNSFFADLTVRGGLSTFKFDTQHPANGNWGEYEKLNFIATYYLECGVIASDRIDVGVFCMSGLRHYEGEPSWNNLTLGLSLTVGLD